MTFGKPKLSTTRQVRCIECGEQYPEAEIKLEHAGRIEVADASGPTEPGDYWNSECPVCGVFNMMGEEYTELNEEEFKEKQHEMARKIHKHRNSKQRSST